MTDVYSFRVDGFIVPYVRMTRRGKYVDPRAQLYLSSKDAVTYQIQNQMALADMDMFKHKTPLFASVNFTLERALHKSDLDNQLKAVFDAMNKVVYTDDCWIDGFTVLRELGDVYKTLITIKPMVAVAVRNLK